MDPKEDIEEIIFDFFSITSLRVIINSFVMRSFCIYENNYLRTIKILIYS